MKGLKKISIAVATTLCLLALAVPALAAGAQAATPYEQQVLQARYDAVSARVNFAVGVYTDTASLVANASDLTAHADKLNADLGTLKGYVGSSDKDGFNSYLTGTIQPDMQAGAAAFKADRQQFKAWGVSASTMQELRADYLARKTTLGQQTDAAIMELGNVRLSYYNDAMAKADERMAGLSAKGIDVSGMQAVKSGAMANVVSPLQSAIASGNADSVKAELHDKCLANGQPYSYHFYAKMDLEALKAASAKIGASTNNSTILEQLAGVNAKLSGVESTLNAVGTSPYTSGQESQISGDLKSASEELKTIIKELKGQNTQG